MEFIILAATKFIRWAFPAIEERAIVEERLEALFNN